jgi:hypothetical protein
MSIKLSDNQKEVIKLMREGWGLGKSNGLSTRSWLQKNGIGRGGEAKTISNNTFLSLVKKKLIAQKKYDFPTATYILTELGKTIEL